MMMWDTSTKGITAEWQCTNCGVTNRKLVPLGAREANDRCLHCGIKHVVRPGDTPVRWQAEAS
jgi:DNA-directed RNA polymerase subunit RPC12/RpoP